MAPDSSGWCGRCRGSHEGRTLAGARAGSSAPSADAAAAAVADCTAGDSGSSAAGLMCPCHSRPAARWGRSSDAGPWRCAVDGKALDVLAVVRDDVAEMLAAQTWDSTAGEMERVAVEYAISVAGSPDKAPTTVLPAEAAYLALAEHYNEQGEIGEDLALRGRCLSYLRNVAGEDLRRVLAHDHLPVVGGETPERSNDGESGRPPGAPAAPPADQAPFADPVRSVHTKRRVREHRSARRQRRRSRLGSSSDVSAGKDVSQPVLDATARNVIEAATTAAITGDDRLGTKYHEPTSAPSHAALNEDGSVRLVAPTNLFAIEMGHMIADGLMDPDAFRAQLGTDTEKNGAAFDEADMLLRRKVTEAWEETAAAASATGAQIDEIDPEQVEAWHIDRDAPCPYEPGWGSGWGGVHDHASREWESLIRPGTTPQSRSAALDRIREATAELIP